MEEDFKQKAFQLLGNLIRKKRIEQGFTQEDLGQKVGYGELTRRQAISQIERGGVAIPNKKLNLFINALKMDNTFITEVNFLISKGNYEDAAHLLEDREAEERKIATSLSAHIPVTTQDTISMSLNQSGPDPEKLDTPHTEKADGDVNPTIKNTLEAFTDNPETKLTKLKILFEKELITEEEYTARKKDILDRYF